MKKQSDTEESGVGQNIDAASQNINDKKIIDQLEYDIRRVEKLLNRVIFSTDPIQKTLVQSYQTMIGKREELLALLYRRQVEYSQNHNVNNLDQKAG